jgi:hypothetical protein
MASFSKSSAAWLDHRLPSMQDIVDLLRNQEAVPVSVYKHDAREAGHASKFALKRTWKSLRLQEFEYPSNFDLR